MPPSESSGINVPVYPELNLVPRTPVYYDPTGKLKLLLLRWPVLGVSERYLVFEQLVQRAVGID